MPFVEVTMAALPLDTAVRLEADGGGIVVVRTAGAVVAYEDVCPHAGWRLSSGEVRDGQLECPGHGWTFRLETGECTLVPGYCLGALPVVTRGAIVRIATPERGGPPRAGSAERPAEPPDPAEGRPAGRCRPSGAAPLPAGRVRA